MSDAPPAPRHEGTPAIHPLVERLGAARIAAAVGARYGLVAERPPDRTGEPVGFPAGRAFAESLGYPAELLDRLPVACTESFTGAGNPHPHVDLPAGGTLLDLGCGAGLDLVRYGLRFPDALLVGVDFAPAMVAKAAANVAAAGLDARVLRAPADRVPEPDRLADRITANGILNLSPDRAAIAREARRLLRPGGRWILAEIVLVGGGARPAATLEEWFRCTGGAMTEGELHELLRGAGFEEVRTLELGRNARTGHPAARAGVFTARRPGPG